MLAGIEANFFKLPALAMILAPTAVPSIAARFGATKFICVSTCSSSFFLSSFSSRICFANNWTIARFSGEMSPPLLFFRITESISTFESGNPASSNTFSVISSLFPARTICE